MLYHVLAQDMFSSRQIAKVIPAPSEAKALQQVSAELHDAGYYPVSITSTNSEQKEPFPCSTRI